MWQCTYSQEDFLATIEVHPPKPLVRRPLMSTKECWAWMQAKRVQLAVAADGSINLYKEIYSREPDSYLCSGKTFRQAVTRAARKVGQ